MPRISTVPSSGRTIPRTDLMSVVFPAPFGPNNPTIEPVSTSKLTSSTAVTASAPSPNRLERLVTETATSRSVFVARASPETAPSETRSSFPVTASNGVRADTSDSTRSRIVSIVSSSHVSRPSPHVVTASDRDASYKNARPTGRVRSETEITRPRSRLSRGDRDDGIATTGGTETDVAPVVSGALQISVGTGHAFSTGSPRRKCRPSGRIRRVRVRQPCSSGRPRSGRRRRGSHRVDSPWYRPRRPTSPR